MKRKERGQIVLILVLITIVGLTIGLSLISRTVTDVRISTQIEQSGKAFSAAEAGVESALKSAVVGGAGGTVNLPDSSASYNVAQLGGSTGSYSFPLTEIGRAQTVWLIEHNSDGTVNETGSSYPSSSSIDICWGTDSNNTAAIVVSLYYKTGSVYKVSNLAYDPIATRGNNFTIISDTAGGYCNGNYQFRKTIIPTLDFGIDPASTLLALRILPLYQNTTIALLPTSTLPIQGKLITSIGQSDTGVVRKINVSQGYPVLPSLLDFVLFTEN